MVSFQSGLVELHQFFAKSRGNLPVGYQQPHTSLEPILRRNLIEHVDSFDQPIEAQTNCGVRYIVMRGQLFKGTRRQDQSLNELLVFLFQMYKPCGLVSHKNENIALNKTKVYFNIIKWADSNCPYNRDLGNLLFDS